MVAVPTPAEITLLPGLGKRVMLFGMRWPLTVLVSLLSSRT